MKKILCILLTAVMLFGMAACANLGSAETTDKVLMVPATRPSEPEETTPVYSRPDDEEEDGEEGDFGAGQENENESTQQKPEEEETAPDGDGDTGDGFADDDVTSNPQGTAGELSWDNINSFAIKSGSMTVEQLRTLCVDFFRYAKTALWTPDESIQFVKNAKGSEDFMTGGQLYGGLPYVGSASGNVYRLLDYMDAQGVVTMSDMLDNLDGMLSRDALKYFGNQCANGAHVGWSRVINSNTGFATMRMTQDCGYIPLGPYTYDTAKIKSWKDANGYRTSDIVRANGQQTMFASYALLKKADGLVYYTTAGHVIMAATDAHVEYVPNSTMIDGSKSYITIIDQAQKWESYTTADGRIYQIKSSVDAKVTFNQLYQSNYVPFTFGEFLGTDPVEETSCTFSHTGATATMQQLFSAKVTSNYAITDAYIIVTNSDGDQMYKHAVRNANAWGKTLNMAQTGANVDSWGTAPVSGSYTVEVVAQLGTGERLTVYSGQLTA